jgi:transposase
MGTLCRGKDCKVKRKRYSRKFQRMAVERMKTSEDVGELAQELGVTRRCLYKWRTKLEVVEPGEEASRPSTHASSYRKEIQQLKRLLAEKAMEVDFFKGALQKVEARRQKKDGTGGMTSTTKSEN